MTHNDQNHFGGVNVVQFIYIHNKKCEECNAKTLAYDPQHDLIYCLACGLVHSDNSPTDYDKLMEQRAKEMEEKRQLKHKLRLQQRDERILINKDGNFILVNIFICIGKAPN